MEGHRSDQRNKGRIETVGRVVVLIVILAGVSLSRCGSTLTAQDLPAAPASLPDAALLELLARKGSLTLRDATLVEAMFALRQQWAVDMVMSSSLEGQVSATFVDTSLREILDSLLISRGYGYQVVGRSIVVLPLDQLGAFKPLFESELVPLQFADPDELLDVTELLLSPQGKAVALQAPRGLMVMDYPDRTKLIRQRLLELDVASRPSLPQMMAAVPNQVPIGTPGGSDAQPVTSVELDVRVFRPQYVTVATLLPAIESLITDDGRVAVLDKEDQIVVADRKEVMDVVEEAVAALDRPRAQVRIWAMIYDCSLQDVERVGINWNGRVFGNSRRADGVTPADQLAISSLTAASPAASAANGAITLMSLGTNVDVTAVINLLKQSSESRLLADPNVVVTNHEPAMIQIVTEIPYQQLTQGLQGGSIGTTAFREAGVTLEVTPHIARDYTISMLVNPRFSVLTGFTETTEQPIIDRREAKTTVRVRNGETFVLGGLRQRTKVENRTGIPYLKDVKYVGKLFRARDETFRDSELLVFITPEIISVDDTSRPRELVARDHGFEHLNRNRIAPQDNFRATDWDPNSFGGPVGPAATGFAVPAMSPPSGMPAGSSAAPQSSSRNTMQPPYEDPPQFSDEDSEPGRVRMPVLLDSPEYTDIPGRAHVTEPLTKRLENGVPLDESDDRRGGGNRGRATDPSVPDGLLPDAGGLPGGGLNRLLELLPMSGTRERSGRSRVRLLNHDGTAKQP